MGGGAELLCRLFISYLKKRKNVPK